MVVPRSKSGAVHERELASPAGGTDMASSRGLSQREGEMRGTFIYIGLALLFMSVSACTSTTVWYKQGGTPQEFSSDASVCDEVLPSLSDAIGSGFAGAANLRLYYDRCMVARGWFAREAPILAAGSLTWGPGSSSFSDACPSCPARGIGSP
jgi:hypothetical protein